MKNKYILISIALNIILTFILALVFYGNKKEPNKNIGNLNTECLYSLKNFYFHYNADPDSTNILMFGNSLIRWGDWQTLLHRNDVLNRGISGDVLHCMCERLKYLENVNARLWIIEGGINDINPTRETDINQLFINFKNIIDFVKSKNAIPVINLTLYINRNAGDTWSYRKDYKSINNDVDRLNNLLIEYAQNNNIQYIDLNASLSKDMELLSEYTTDGIHLNDKGYQIWANKIIDIIRFYNI